jgi:Zn-dependent protease
MLGMPEPTPYDLRFRFLGIPVRVHPLFWLIMALLGPTEHPFNPQSTLIWVACGFFSVLVHEFGHALMSRLFHCPPAIVLYGMGGLCYSDTERQTPWQRLAVLISGPGAGFLLLGVVVLVGVFANRLQSFGTVGDRVFFDLVLMNLVWNVVNLFPIWPLDGGQMLGVALSMVNRRNGMRWAHVVALLTAGIFALLAFQYGSPFLGIFFAYFAVINYQVLQSLHHAAKYGNLEDDADWWKR